MKTLDPLLELYKKGEWTINRKDEEGKTLLHLAVIEDREDLVDLLHVGHQRFGVVQAALHLHVAALLGSLPEDVVELGVGLDVVGLDEVGPQDQQLFLGQVRLLFLDRGVAREGVVVLDVGRLVGGIGDLQGQQLLGHGDRSLGGDAGAGGVGDVRIDGEGLVLGDDGRAGVVGVVDEEPTVLLVVRMEGQAEQAALPAAAPPLRRA